MTGSSLFPESPYMRRTLEEFAEMTFKPSQPVTAGNPRTVASRGSPSISPRLFGLKASAKYLGVSYGSTDDWVLQGLLPVFEMPPLRAPKAPAHGKRTGGC